MRVNPNFVPDVLAGLQQSQTALNTALQEVSTGKQVTHAQTTRLHRPTWFRTPLRPTMWTSTHRM